MPEIIIQAPLGGIDKRFGYQNQPPFTTFSSNNYWPFDVDSGRLVTATRPSQEPFIAPGTTVEGLIELNGQVTGKPVQSMVAVSSGSIYWYDGTTWQLATGAQATSADTGRAVYGRSYLQQTFIMKANAAPILFDYELATATTATAVAGNFPQDCRFAEVWQGSLWIAGQLDKPHVLYGSRTGNPLDWDFGAPSSDEGGAFFFADQNEGLIRGPITAIVGHTSDSMIISSFDGLTQMRGHPRRGGIVEQASNDLVILGQGAFARTSDDEIYMMTQKGLAILAPDPNARPILVSRNKIPDSLIGLEYTYTDPVIAMSYSSRWDCVYISVRGNDQQCWMYDRAAGGFHQMTLDNYPFCMLEFEPEITADKCGVLFGSSS